MKRRELLQFTALLGTSLGIPGMILRPQTALAKSTASPTDSELAKVPVTLIGLPYLMGTRAPNSMFGMAQGPVVLLQPENLPKALRSCFADVEVIMLDNLDEPESEELARGDQMARILGQNLALARTVKEARAKGRLPIASIGTCSASIGMVGGLCEEAEDVGMIWFDAHADAQTPDNTSDVFIEGMVVPIIAGKVYPRYSRRIPGFKPIPPERIVQVSLGSLPYPIPSDVSDPPMGTPVHKEQIDKLGVAGALAPALEALARRCKKVYVHLDADTIDPSVYKNFRVPWKLVGMSAAQVQEAFALIARKFEILALDVAALDPTVDVRAPRVLTPLVLQGAKDAARSRLLSRV